MALALIHHLAIANNVPLDRVADFFRQLGAWLIIEFVPKSDPQVQRLLAARKDIFTDHPWMVSAPPSIAFIVLRRKNRSAISQRILFLMKRRG